MKRVHVKVPATSANLGPGFDVLGVALPLFNEVTMQINGGGWTSARRALSLSVDIEGEGFDVLPRDQSHSTGARVGIQLGGHAGRVVRSQPALRQSPARSNDLEHGHLDRRPSG